MAFAAAARRSLASRSLYDHLACRLQPALPHLFPLPSTSDPRNPSPLAPPPAPRSLHSPFPFPPPGTAQTLNLLPFGLHLARPPRRGFSSFPSSDHDFAAVTHAAAPASFPGEVAWATEGSSLASAAVQHLIDAVHSFTGLNWWLSIALSTALVRCVLFASWRHARKLLYVDRKELLQVAKLLENPQNDPSKDDEALRATMTTLRKFGLSVFTPMIMTPYTGITFYIAISNMVEKVPSLKGGGAFWFTDLTTPDALYIFPTIISLSVYLTMELKLRNMKTSRTGSSNSWGYKLINYLRLLSPLAMLVTASLPQAVSCALVTWSFGSLAESIAHSQPAVRKLLYGVPIEPARSSPDESKRPTAGEDEQPVPPSPVKENEQPVPPETRKPSDASVYRIRDQSDNKSEKGD